MTLYPMPIVRLCRFLNWISNAKDCTLLFIEQRKIEDEGSFILSQIEECRTIAQTYSINKMLVNFIDKHGNTPQVQGWVGSINLEVNKRQSEILTNL